MKKILFINMPVRKEALPNILPLGPMVLATHLNKIGHKAELLDLNALRCNEQQCKTIITNKLNETSYDIIALSGLITTLKFQELISSCKTDEHLVAGGGLATDIKEQLFDWIPQLDAINIGPGETSIDSIVNDRQQRVFYGNNPSNLDDWNIDYSLAMIDTYITNPIWGASAKNSSTAPFMMKRSLNSVSSRGCPYSCKFCDREATGGKNYKMRSAQSLVDEMILLTEEYNIDFLGYIDDNATLNLGRLKKLCGLMKEKGISLNWGAHARMDDIGRTPAKAKLLKESNCIYLGFGGESANMDILKKMNKGSIIYNSGTYRYEGRDFPKIYIDALDYCRTYDIHCNVTWIMGYPTETLEQLQDTVAFILFMEDEGYVDKRYNNKSLFVATAYPNTELFNEPIVQEKINKAFNTYKEYIYSLGDATKTIVSNNTPLNYSCMSDDVFLEARRHAENNKIESIMAM